MSATADEALAVLRADWPLWEIWIVQRYAGGDLWCARRHDDHRRLLHAGNVDELAEYLEEASSL